MKVAFAFFFFLFCFLQADAQSKNAAGFLRQEMPFKKYGFERTNYDDGGFEFLMGNGEMGGRVHYSGLGLEKLWFADYWKNPKQREFLPGILIADENMQQGKPSSYKSLLNIDKAVCYTEAAYGNGISYKAELFFSFADDHLIGLRVINNSSSALSFHVVLPVENFNVEKINANKISGTNQSGDYYNKASWTISSSVAINESLGKFTIPVPAGGSAELFYSVATQHDAANHQQLSMTAISRYKNFQAAMDAHVKAWKNIRSKIASVILPESDYARWFCRCIYTNYATAGSKKFLAAETQFAYPEEDWDMHPFTYGHGSWAALSFMNFGDSARAKRSLKWLYQPEALRKNIKTLIPDTGCIDITYKKEKVDNACYLKSYPKNAFAFGHELTDFGEDIPYVDNGHWDLQFHLNGFASSLFNRYNNLYGDKKFEKDVVAPVVTGTANFWKALLKKDETSGKYNLPPMLSLSENIVKPSVLDAVLAAKWNLHAAHRYETKFNGKSDFKNLAQNIYVPQNDSIYLEYLNDKQDRAGGGYFGIRACAYLGFPLYEQLKNIDKAKARKTLDLAWQRNSYGKGMISFVASWFALTEAYMGNGDNALDRSENTLKLQDKTGTILYEAFAYNGDSVRSRFNPYFLTGYSAFTLVPVAMMLQSYDNKILFFPAMPSSWNNVSFYDLPAEGGFTVSGIYRSKDDFDIAIKKKGKLIKTLHNVKSIDVDMIK